MSRGTATQPKRKATRTTAAGRVKQSKPVRGKGRPGLNGASVGKQSLLDAARSLVKHTRGGKISRSALARATGVDQRLVRYYFPSYDDLMDLIVDASIHDLQDTMEKASTPRASAAEVMLARVEALFGFMEQNPTFFNLMLDRVYDDTRPTTRSRMKGLTTNALERLQGVVQAGQEQRAFRSDFDTRFLYAAILGMAEFYFTARPVMNFLFGPEERATLEGYKRFVFDLVMRGIAEPTASQG